MFLMLMVDAPGSLGGLNSVLSDQLLALHP
jgi:hypothetical protein